MGNKLTYFVEHEKKTKRYYTENEVISILEFLNDNIFLEYGGHIFHHDIGILMGTNCAPLIVHFVSLLLFGRVHIKLIKHKHNTEAKVIPITFRYT